MSLSFAKLNSLHKREDKMSRSFMSSLSLPVEERTIGVIARNDDKIMDGYMLFSAGYFTFLVDSDGRIVNEWSSSRGVFAAYLNPETGNLVRDGSESMDAPLFKAGGAAGFIECVSWENETLWHHTFLPMYKFLTHHSLEILPNGNVLVLVWERKLEKEMRELGRRKELIPDGEVWDNLVVELQPDLENKTADCVWQWSLMDHAIQDEDPSKKNYVERIEDHPEKFDINCCARQGKMGERNRTKENKTGKQGEKDWLHVNNVSYCPIRDQVLLSFNVHSEIAIIDHSKPTEELKGPAGDLLYRWGNPLNYRRGTRTDQKLFCQHSAQFIENGTKVILFNNGRVPDRAFSTVDVIELPEIKPGVYVQPGTNKEAYGPESFCWRFGKKKGHKDSFYATHISSCQRLPNGNTLICLGTHGIVMEVDPHGEEVFRYISPVSIENRKPNMLQVFRQGYYVDEKSSLFHARKYPASQIQKLKKDLTPGRYVEC